MQMQINTKKFGQLIRKSTVNYSIDCLQLKIDANSVSSSMVAGAKDILTNLKLDNTFITGIGPEDRIVLNFSDPAITVSRYLDVFNEEWVDLTIEENVKIVLSSGERKLDIFMVDDAIIKNHISVRSAKEMEYFLRLAVNEDFFRIFDIHKKVSFYNKIYFGVKNKSFFIESTDRTNSGVNRVNDKICTVDVDDLVMCFEFRNILALVNVMEEDPDTEFTLNFTFSKAEDRGIIYGQSKDEKEKYFVVSRSL